MKNRRLFISIFAVSLAVTLLVSPVKVFNNPVVETIQVKAEEEPITDTQRGIALLMTILFAQGLRFVGDWHTVVSPGIEKLWNDFSSATGNTVTIPMLVAGSSLALGYIRTSNTVNNAINNFTMWYRQTYSQPNTGNVNVPVASGSTRYTAVPLGSAYVSLSSNNLAKWYNSNANEIRTVLLTDGTIANNHARLYFFSLSYNNGTVHIKYNNDSNVYSTSRTVNADNVMYYFDSMELGYTFAKNFAVAFSNSYPDCVVTTNNIADYNIALSYTYGVNASINDVTMEGQSLELKDGYQLESDQAKLYDIAGLEALVASLALTLENIDDLVRDIPLIFDTPWAEDFPDVPAYVDTPDDTIPWVDVPDSVIPADTPEYVPTIPSERDEYKVLGLEQVFPFSIPFDLYYLSQILVADPVTPQYTFAVYNPVTHNLISQQIDLSSFDTVASVFRTSEVVLFIAFLIWITRFLIRS